MTQLNEHRKFRGKGNVPLLLDFPLGDQLVIYKKVCSFNSP